MGYPPSLSDIKLAQRARGIFYPRTFSINLDGATTLWSDDDPVAVKNQLEIFKRAGIDFLAVDSYAGYYQDQPYSELHRPLEVIAQEMRSFPMKFANVMCFRLPKAVVPVDHPSKTEPNRYFDLNLKTLVEMIQYSSQYWDHPNYLSINNGRRPVVYIYGLTAEILAGFRKNMTGRVSPLLIGKWMRAQGKCLTDKIPFLIGVVDTPLMISVINQQNFDMLSTMCGLPDFSDQSLIPKQAKQILPPINSPLVEDYSQLLVRRMTEWYSLATAIPYLCFYPSITLGWNPRGRAAHGTNLDLRGYPYSPVVHDPFSSEILKMFDEVALFYLWTMAHLLEVMFQSDESWRYFDSTIKSNGPMIPSLPTIATIFAANEVTEGASLLPEVKGDHLKTHVDVSVLAAVTQGISNFKDAYEEFLRDKVYNHIK